MDGSLQALLDKRPSFTSLTRELVEAYAHNAQGQVCCAHCEQPITDEQQVTLNHRNPWQAIKVRLAHNKQFLALDRDSQWQHLCEKYNEVYNLEPLHAACHIEIDEGRQFTGDEAIWLNLKPHLRQGPRPIVQQCKNNGRVVETIDYTKLLDAVILTAEQEAQMNKAPFIVQSGYISTSRDRLDELATKIEKLENQGQHTHRCAKLMHQQELLAAQTKRLSDIAKPSYANGHSAATIKPRRF